jgi:hypothetical protein
MEWSDGTRVRLAPCAPWPDGAVGTVRLYPDYITKLCGGADGCTRVTQGARGPLTMVWVVFDQAVRDGDGDGPYFEAEILSEYLSPL